MRLILAPVSEKPNKIDLFPFLQRCPTGLCRVDRSPFVSAERDYGRGGGGASIGRLLAPGLPPTGACRGADKSVKTDRTAPADSAETRAQSIKRPPPSLPSRAAAAVLVVTATHNGLQANTIYGHGGGGTGTARPPAGSGRDEVT